MIKKFLVVILIFCLVMQTYSFAYVVDGKQALEFIKDKIRYDYRVDDKIGYVIHITSEPEIYFKGYDPKGELVKLDYLGVLNRVPTKADILYSVNIKYLNGLYFDINEICGKYIIERKNENIAYADPGL